MGGERGLKWTISTLALIGVWMLLGAGGAAAQDYTRDGWYAGARGLWGVEDFDARASADDTWGFDAYAGYRMGKNFAGEIEFEYFDGFDADLPGGGSGDYRLFSMSLGMKVFPLARAFAPGSIYQRVQPYVTAAPSWQWVQSRSFSGGNAEGDDGGFAGRFGAGLEIYLTESIVLTGDASYSLPVGGASDFSYWTFGGGFQWRFAGPED